ncbi:MAG: hypothetical protein GWN41_03080 [Phycisphaerae bacterium]|nr:hypothetical protein [Phycisphaerae bacterium]
MSPLSLLSVRIRRIHLYPNGYRTINLQEKDNYGLSAMDYMYIPQDLQYKGQARNAFTELA